MEGGASAEDCEEALTLGLGFPLLWPRGGPDQREFRPLIIPPTELSSLALNTQGMLGEATYYGNPLYCPEGSGHMAPGCGVCPCCML